MCKCSQNGGEAPCPPEGTGPRKKGERGSQSRAGEMRPGDSSLLLAAGGRWRLVATLLSSRLQGMKGGWE